MRNTLYDAIEIPMGTFGLNDEKIGNFDGALKFVLSEYAKLPIKELNNKSLNDLGIDIEFCKRALNKEIDSKIGMYMQRNNCEYITEDVLWKNMTNEEKVNKFLKNLIEIGSKDKELIIVDPYIFSNQQDEYCEMLAYILNNSRALKIIIVTDENNFKERSASKVLDKINIDMDTKFSNDFHDRFWITNRKKGFYTGTSLTG